jgi:hypothetical protein
MIFVLGPLWFVLAAVILFFPGVLRFIGGGIRVVLIVLLVGWLLAGVTAMLQHIPWLMISVVIGALVLAIGLFFGLLRIYDAVTDRPKDDMKDDDSDMTEYTAEVLGRVHAQRTAEATATATALAVAPDDQTMARPDDSATGIVTTDTMAAPEAVDGETAIIAPADAVTHLDLAWSDEQDVVPYPPTGAVQVDADAEATTPHSWPSTVITAGSILVGAAILAVICAGIFGGHTDTTTTTTTTADPWPTAPWIAAPTQTAPPVTVTPPPVTVMAAPPTITETPAAPTRHVKPAFAPTPAEDQAVVMYITGLGYRITDPAVVISDAQESCRLSRSGERAREVDDTLQAENRIANLIILDGTPVDARSAMVTISSAAVLEYANCY